MQTLKLSGAANDENVDFWATISNLAFNQRLYLAIAAQLNKS